MSAITVYAKKYKYDVIGDYDNDNGTTVQNKTNNLTDAYGNKYSFVITVALTETDGITVDETTIKKLELYKKAIYASGLGAGRKVVLIKNDDVNESIERGVDRFYAVVS